MKLRALSAKSHVHQASLRAKERRSADSQSSGKSASRTAFHDSKEVIICCCQRIDRIESITNVLRGLTVDASHGRRGTLHCQSRLVELEG